MRKLKQLLLTIAIMFFSIIGISGITASPAFAAVPAGCTSVTGFVGKWPQVSASTSYLYNCYASDPMHLANNLMQGFQGIPNTALIGSTGLFTKGPVQVFVFDNWADYRTAFSNAHLVLAPQTCVQEALRLVRTMTVVRHRPIITSS